MRDESTTEYIPYPMLPEGMSSVPIPQRSDRADLIDKIKPEPIVALLRNILMGNEMINGTWVKVPILKDRSLTEIGAWEVSNLLQGTSNIGIQMSKLDDREIKNRLLSLSITLQAMLIQNWIPYGIRNTAQLRYVHEILFTTQLAILKQADDASIQELLGKVINENRNVNTERKEPSQSRMKRLIGM